MSKTQLSVGLVGAGKMGKNHLRVLSMLNGVRVAFVHDANPEAEAQAAASYGVTTARDLDTAMTGVDALIIASPTSTHIDYIRRAAGRVSTLFVEKPLAGTLEESEEVQRIAKQNGMRIQVGFIERFNPAVEVLKRMLHEAPQVVSVDLTRTNKVSSRITDVDVVIDLMIHDIDLALHFNGPVLGVSAHGSRHGDMIDFASAMLTHENGRFTRIQASRITEKKMRMIQATCMDMFIDCDLLRKEIQINRQSEVRQKEGEPYVISAQTESVEVRPQEALLSQLQAFIAFAKGGSAANVPTHLDGLAAMRVCEQVRLEVLS
jgi:predicted dehydrogenase